ncbi:MAG: glycosyltransferase [Anaerolineae bacterium]|jgi:sucrose-phosphate synthase|nr:glycosyltransferase [Anaerolineae bacterium]
MHIAFLNPQGNFDAKDSYWTEHPDFGGQLVYVKQVALAMAALGHTVDIITRQIVDPNWPEFAARFDRYPESERVRIVRLPAGPPEFLRKELLWPHLVREWVPRLLEFFRMKGSRPDAMTTHYGDGGLCGVLLEAETGIPFTFTGHSLGAQKLDKLHLTPETLAEIDAQYFFSRRLAAERLSMNRSAVNITSTRQERFEQYGHPAYHGAVAVEDERRFAVIPPGVNLMTFGKEARYVGEVVAQAHVRAMFARDLAEGRRELPVIIASSRLDPKKNHLALVQAFAQSPALQAAANLVIFTGALENPLHEDANTSPGERAVLADIRRVIAETNLGGKVSAFAVQGQPALAASYRLLAQRPGSVFALTALYEPFGLAPLEAAAAGLPLVVTRNGGPSESLFEDGVEYGVLVDPADPEAIARGLERVVLDAEAWARFAQLGRQRVLDRYTWERTAEGYLRVIEALVADPGARRPAELLPIPAYFRNPDEGEEELVAALRELIAAPGVA